MAALTGKDLFLKFGSTVLDTDYRSFSVSEEGGIVAFYRRYGEFPA